ncbi:MAG: hypothetical protein KAS12_00255, partial [Candidatus Aenigmarchaeota archaeon]|nr:hypothetical protein [Candidatus Aenigmarchaeota archaeon]
MPKKKIFWGWIILSFISFILITNNLQAEVTTTIPVLSNQTTTPILIKSKDEPSTPLVSVETKVKGNLKISTSKQAIFPDVNLNEVPDEGLVTNSQIEQVIAKDSRHNSPGWSVTATNTHFYNNESEQIAVNNLTIVPGDISGKDP